MKWHGNYGVKKKRIFFHGSPTLGGPPLKRFRIVIPVARVGENLDTVNPIVTVPFYLERTVIRTTHLMIRCDSNLRVSIL